MVFLSPQCPYSQAGEGLRQERWETLVLLLREWGGRLIYREIMFSQFLLQFWGCVSWLQLSLSVCPRCFCGPQCPAEQELGGRNRNPSWEGQEQGLARLCGWSWDRWEPWEILPLLIQFLCSVLIFQDGKKSRLWKVSFQLLNLPLRLHPPTPTNGPCSFWRSLCPRREEQEPSKPALLFARLLCQLTVISRVNIPGRSSLNPPLLAWRVRKRGHWLLETGKRRQIQTFGFYGPFPRSFLLPFLVALEKSCGNFSRSTWQFP